MRDSAEETRVVPGRAEKKGENGAQSGDERPVEAEGLPVSKSVGGLEQMAEKRDERRRCGRAKIDRV